MFNTSIWFIAKFDILKNLSKDEKCLLEKSMEVKIVKQNEEINFQDNKQKFIYFLKKGSINIIYSDKNEYEKIKYTLISGNVFGELPINNDKNIADKAIATTNSLVCIVNTQIIKQLMRDNSKLSFTIHKLLGARVLKIERKLETLIFKNCKTRIIDFLKYIANEYGIFESNSFILKNFLTKNNIAKLTGTTPDTVIQILNDLQIKNMLKFKKGQIEIFFSMLQ